MINYVCRIYFIKWLKSSTKFIRYKYTLKKNVCFIHYNGQNKDFTNYGQKSPEIIFKMWIYRQNVDAKYILLLFIGGLLKFEYV
jgi:hypothetical protein